MRLLRLAGYSLAALLVLALSAAWLAPRLLDWNRYRGAIAGIAATSLGRPVQITGPISLTLLPRPVLAASGVELPDPGDGSSADVAELRLQVGLGSLLTGRLNAENLTLQGARMRLPWPLRAGALQQGAPLWMSGLHARVADGTLLVGGLTISDITGTLASDPVTGTFSVDGMVAGLGRRWRVTARLGRAGGDGSAPLEASLDGLDATQDTGGTLSGQLAGDGTLAGRVTGRGRDLSQLMAGPAVAWHAAGRFRGADGLALADDLDAEVGGVPARAAVALRLLPAARLDIAVAASRLDLDAWLPNLLHGAGTTIPTSLDLSAEAAALGGGTLRHVRIAFDLAADGVSLREAQAILPGDATATLSGRLAGGRFAGAGRILAPHLRQTLGWLQPGAWLRQRAWLQQGAASEPGALAALPAEVLQTASLGAAVSVAGGQLALDGLNGVVDGNAVTGMVALTPGARPQVTGTLAVSGLDLDHWLPQPPADLPGLAASLAGWPGAWGAFDASLALAVAQPRWRGVALDRLDFDGFLQAGTLTVRRAALTGAGLGVGLAGVLAPGGHVTAGRLDATLDRAAVLAPFLPAFWPPGLFSGAATLHATGAGPVNALGLTLQAGVGDLRIEAAGTANLAAPGWTGSVDLHHPGAPRLLEALGVPGVASWLGDGSFSLEATLGLDPHLLTMGGLALSAGGLRMTGDLRLDRGDVPALSGHVDAETLPLPLPYARSPEPLPTAALRGWRGQVAVRAAHVLFGLSPALDDARATVSLADAALHVAGLTASVAGGTLKGDLALDAAGAPRLSVQGSLAGAALTGPLLDGTLDVAGGVLTVSAALHAAGFSPGALLATLEGQVQAEVKDGVLTGVDLPAAVAALALPDAGAVQAGVLTALQGGRTPFATLSAAIELRRGAAAVRQATMRLDAGQAVFAGTVDLPIDAADLSLTFAPRDAGAPALGVRFIGPAEAPRRAPDLAALAGWLASR